MKAFKFSVAALALATLLTACNNNDTNDVVTDGEIRLMSATQNMDTSRAAGDLQNEQFDNATKVAVFINENVATGVTPSTSYTQPLTYTADGAGALTPPTGSQPYFPKSGNAVTIYACHPYAAASAGVDTDKDFTVAADQSVDANYIASDLMQGLPTVNPVRRVSWVVPLTFTHLLTKVNITLTAGDGLVADDLRGATVKLKGLLPTIAFNAKTGITGSAKGDAKDIIVMKTADNATSFTGSAIVVPQTIAEGATFLEVSLRFGGVLLYKLPAALTLASTKQHNYTIKVSLTELNISTTINDWGSTTDSNGNAVMPEKGYAIGDLYPNKTNPIGVVYEISNGGKNGKIISSNNTIDNWHGCKDWCTNKTTGGKTWALPTKEELTEISKIYRGVSPYTEADATKFKGALSNVNPSYYYATSLEVSDYVATAFCIGNGGSLNVDKTYTISLYACAVAAF